MPAGSRKAPIRPARRGARRRTRPRRGRRRPVAPLATTGGRTAIAISNPHKAVRVSPRDLRRLIEFVGRREGLRLGSVDLAIVAAQDMLGINRRYLHHNWDTDVLSFDLSGPDSTGPSLQLIVSGDAAVRRGPPHGHSPREELMVYVIHGLLHLTGYEDTTVRGAAAMRARQDELLADFLRLRPRTRRRAGRTTPRPGGSRVPRPF